MCNISLIQCHTFFKVNLIISIFTFKIMMSLLIIITRFNDVSKIFYSNVDILYKNSHRTDSYLDIWSITPIFVILHIKLSPREIAGAGGGEGQMGWGQFNDKSGIEFKDLNFKFSVCSYIPPNRLANNSLDNHPGNLITICDMVINDFYFWLVTDLDYRDYNQP